MITLPSLSRAVSSTVYVPGGRSNKLPAARPEHEPPSRVFRLPAVVFRTLPSASMSLPSSLATAFSMVGEMQTVPYSQS